MELYLNVIPGYKRLINNDDGYNYSGIVISDCIEGIATGVLFPQL